MRRKEEEVKEVQAIVHRIDPTDAPGALCRITQVQQTLAEKEAAALAARQARSADFHARATRLETRRTHLQTGGSK
jgi:hypothetical protein